MKVKEGSEKVGLKLNIQKTKIMASGPNISWQIDEETMETVTEFIFGDSKIIVHGDYSHEIKTLTPWKKSYDQPRQHIKKKRHYFVNKGPSSQGCGYPVVMYGCESWNIKKTEWQIIKAFELWCQRRLFESPSDCKEI